MNQIITVAQNVVGTETIQTVNARELHEYLGVGKVFRSWITERIEAFDFKEGEDYLMTNIGRQLPSGTKYSNEYFVSLDMAKELSMVDRGTKGKEARKYFLECEKKANASLNLNDPSQLRSMLLGYTEKVLELQTKITEDKPKVLFHDAVTASENTKTVEEVAKSLGIGRNKLFSQLRQLGLLCKNNLPRQRFIDAGCFEVVTYEFKDQLGVQRSNEKSVVTGKGQTYIHKLLNDIQ